MKRKPLIQDTFYYFFPKRNILHSPLGKQNVSQKPKEKKKFPTLFYSFSFPKKLQLAMAKKYEK
jgi:hypothetical protein